MYSREVCITPADLITSYFVIIWVHIYLTNIKKYNKIVIQYYCQLTGHDWKLFGRIIFLSKLALRKTIHTGNFTLPIMVNAFNTLSHNAQLAYAKSLDPVVKSWQTDGKKNWDLLFKFWFQSQTLFKVIKITGIIARDAPCYWNAKVAVYSIWIQYLLKQKRQKSASC